MPTPKPVDVLTGHRIQCVALHDSNSAACCTEEGVLFQWGNPGSVPAAYDAPLSAVHQVAVSTNSDGPITACVTLEGGLSLVPGPTAGLRIVDGIVEVSALGFQNVIFVALSKNNSGAAAITEDGAL